MVFKEEWVFELGVFEAKDGGSWNVSVEREEERNVVRSGSDTRGEGAIWEQATKISVEEGTVKPGQGRGGPLVAPSVEPIQERELKESERVDAGVEGLS